MKYLGKPFIQDNQGIFYLDSKTIKTKEFHFNEIKSAYSRQRKFYYIEGVDDYIIKDTTKLPFFFNGTRTKLILKNFMNVQNEFNDIDFPIGYFIDNNKIEGTVVPYYKNSISIKKLITIYSLEELKKYYYYDDNDNINLINMCLEILDLIERMYQKNIVYTDINAGNFLVYNNTVKIIDFEPDYVYFTKHKQKYYKLLLSNYTVLIDYIWRRYKYNDVIYNSGESFDDARCKVKALIKEKRG